MQQGYTLAEWEEMDRQKAVRRSFFQKSRRLERELRLDKFWPLYKRLREALRAELECSFDQVDDALLDTQLEKALPRLAGDLARLFAEDRKARDARRVIAAGGPHAG